MKEIQLLQIPGSSKMLNASQPNSVSFTETRQNMSSFGATEPHKSLKTDSDNLTWSPLVQALKLPVDQSIVALQPLPYNGTGVVTCWHQEW